MVRFKNRYLLTEVRGDGACPNKAQLLEAIRESVRVSFGDVGHAVVALALQIKYYNEETGLCIIRASRDHFRHVWAAMSFLTSFQHKDLALHVIHVAGTIRSCQKAAVAHNREWLKEAQTWVDERDELEALRASEGEGSEEEFRTPMDVEAQ